MRMPVVGATGTIGRAVVARSVAAGRCGRQRRKTGEARPLAQLSDADFQLSVSNKLLRQVNHDALSCWHRAWGADSERDRLHA